MVRIQKYLIEQNQSKSNKSPGRILEENQIEGDQHSQTIMTEDQY